MANAKVVFVKMSALFLIVVLLLEHASARNCAEMEKIMNCNECIRCGGHWCNKPDKQGKHCSEEETSAWCPKDRESLHSIPNLTTRGVQVSPVYAETTAFIHVPNKLTVSYQAEKEPHVKISKVNTTQNFNFDLKSQTHCSSGNCTTNLHVTPKSDFCSQTGRPTEIFSIKVTLGEMEEDVMVNYHVPCACDCSKHVEKNAKQCSGKGDLSCGVCSCRNGWAGEFCEKKICESNRGDLQCTSNARNDVECSGNGFCNACQSCECYTDREGSQYFDKDNYCADLCMVVNDDCDECLSNPIQGVCEECSAFSGLVMHKYNKTAVLEVDEYDRKVWVTCNETLTDGCYVEYVAKRDRNGEIHVMVRRLCETIIAAYVPGPVNVTIPVVVGIIGVLAAAAAVGGFLLHKHRTPPLPLADPHYQNIGAEDCVGENPLYKPPTSSFKNPTYGKW